VIPRCGLHDGRRDRAQPPDDPSRFVEPTHTPLAGREDAIGYWKKSEPEERNRQQESLGRG
jgi:hypothetical protein